MKLPRNTLQVIGREMSGTGARLPWSPVWNWRKDEPDPVAPANGETCFREADRRKAAVTCLDAGLAFASPTRRETCPTIPACP